MGFREEAVGIDHLQDVENWVWIDNTSSMLDAWNRCQPSPSESLPTFYPIFLSGFFVNFHDFLFTLRTFFYEILPLTERSLSKNFANFLVSRICLYSGHAKKSASTFVKSVSSWCFRLVYLNFYKSSLPFTLPNLVWELKWSHSSPDLHTRIQFTVLQCPFHFKEIIFFSCSSSSSFHFQKAFWRFICHKRYASFWLSWQLKSKKIFRITVNFRMLASKRDRKKFKLQSNKLLMAFSLVGLGGRIQPFHLSCNDKMMNVSEWADYIGINFSGFCISISGLSCQIADSRNFGYLKRNFKILAEARPPPFEEKP